MSETNPLYKLFYKEDPYLNFPLKEDAKLEGWHSDHPVFKELILQFLPKTIIEVGSFKGASAINMASIIKEFELEATIFCVDTFLGGVENWDLGCPEIENSGWTYDMLDWKNGRPDIYSTFMTNVINASVEDIIVPIPNTSLNGYKLLEKQNITADLIYIDGSHEEEDCYNDIFYYQHLLTKNKGIIFGDDYGSTGVKQAVDLYVDTYVMKEDFFIYDNNFWIIRNK